MLKLAATLYQGLEKKKNFCLSPLCIVEGIDKLKESTKGETREEIEQTFKGYKGVNLTKELVVTTGMFVSNSLDLVEGFEEYTKKNNVPWKLCDFVNNPDKELKNINNYIYNQTDGGISNFIKKEDDIINNKTAFISITALVFNGVWKLKFKEFGYRKFKINDYNVVDAKYFKYDDSDGFDFKYKKDEYATMLRVPYENGYNMTFIVPNVDDDEMAEYLKTIDFSTFKNKNLTEVIIPYFSVDQESINLSETLKSIGIKKVFGEEADFGGISNEKLRLQKALHKTIINVDEKGTQVRSVVLFKVVKECMRVGSQFELNTKFWYLVTDEKENAIAMGKIDDESFLKIK